MHGYPEVDLLETLLQPLLQVVKESPVLSRVGHIDKNAREMITRRSSLVVFSANDLAFGGNRAKTLFEFRVSSSEQLGRNLSPIVKLQREQDFVTPQQFSHQPILHQWRRHATAKRGSATTLNERDLLN